MKNLPKSLLVLVPLMLALSGVVLFEYLSEHKPRTGRWVDQAVLQQLQSDAKSDAESRNILLGYYYRENRLNDAALLLKSAGTKEEVYLFFVNWLPSTQGCLPKISANVERRAHYFGISKELAEFGRSSIDAYSHQDLLVEHRSPDSHAARTDAPLAAAPKPAPKWQVLWADKPLDLPHGRALAVRSRGEEVEVAWVAKSTLLMKWQPADQVLTSRQVQAWLKNNEFSSR